MKKLVLSAAIAASAAIAVAATRGKLKPAVAAVKDWPPVAKAVEKVQALRKPADNDDPMMSDQAEAA